ncbi:hypothetical protein [Afifella pfennigii]|uniref:hypothetical protein n=1 Tax=Afifella pfennigii TaxID=209897 RepID=UPI00047C577C|nr:hypothetical protein [Afifella pfennigii]
MSKTRYDWISTLEGLSAEIAKLNLKSSVADEPYWDSTAGKALDKDAYNLSGCADHNGAIARWIDGLVRMGVDTAQIRKALTDLTSRNVYGTFSELAVYGTLLDYGLPFEVQIAATAKDILNPNGSDLDGRLDLPAPILFDIKAFGLQEHLVGRLTEKLSADLAPDFVAVEGSKDVPLELLSRLLSSDYGALKSELAANRKADRDALEFRLRPPSHIQTTVQTLDPYLLAEQNADYAFRFAKQFARRKPFLLVFVIHPWLGGLSLSVNFAEYTDIFARAFARRSFMQFAKDRKTRLFGMTRGTASKLLSGLMFVDCPGSAPMGHLR